MLVDPVVHERFAELSASLPGVNIRIRRSRRTLVSLRRGSDGLRLGLDPRLLAIDADVSVLIVAWVQQGDRSNAGTELRNVLRKIQRDAFTEQPAHPPMVAALPTVGPHIDLASACAGIRARWFPDLPPTQVAWARMVHRRLSVIRFGCYRYGDPARILIHPRLARPWVARVFLEHVLYHELCHHRQACQPQWFRRESMHSKRFRTWERAFPGHAEALAWERAALPWILDDAEPPWIRTRQEVLA